MRKECLKSVSTLMHSPTSCPLERLHLSFIYHQKAIVLRKGGQLSSHHYLFVKYIRINRRTMEEVVLSTPESHIVYRSRVLVYNTFSSMS